MPIPDKTHQRSQRLAEIAKEYGAKVTDPRLRQAIEDQTKILRMDNWATDLQCEQILQRPIPEKQIIIGA